MLTLLVLLFVFLFLLLPLWIVYHPPVHLINYFTRRWPDVLFQVPLPSGSDEHNDNSRRYRKLIALTIDDAPSSYTYAILQTLKEFDARATFFVIGAQARESAVGRERLRQLVAAGMELGNHAMYDEPSRDLSDDELTAEMTEVRNMIRNAYKEGNRLRNGNGVDADYDADGDGLVEPPPLYFRPGSGFFSDRMRQLVHGLGYRIVLGSIYPHDAQISWWRLSAWHILSLARPGAIIVCHDRRSWTVPMLRKVLPELRQRGYRVVTVSELLKAGKEAGSITQ